MVHDLRTTVSPVYLDLLNRLLKFLPTSLSPAALTALSETFASLFKYILVPSVDPSLLEQSWECIRCILPKCIPDIQRVMAEVWGSLLRRLRQSTREKAVTSMASDIKGIEDTCAWALVFACKVFA
jgi:hypothetical protein